MSRDIGKYNPHDIEKKWQKIWAKNKAHETDLNDKKNKFYNLVMFPYPSGDKLHLGHWYNYAPSDSFGRYKKMNGYNVMQPIGFDSFGLPAENFAIKTGVHPRESISQNVEKMRKQLNEMGAMWDWDKEVITSSPEYYQWTQWVFLELYKNGLAYKKKAKVNWCDSCNTVLANEQVEDGKCERCKNEIRKKDLKQWFLKISDYSEKLLDYEDLDWPEKTVLMQKNWIGKSQGLEIDFRVDEIDEILTAYTTRPDTIYSTTFLCISPENPLVDILVEGTDKEKEVEKLRKKIESQSDIERMSDTGDDKLGVFTGRHAINPVNGEKMPIYVANFVLMYGTGVVMANAHDQRDFEFARKYNIPLKFVISEDGNPIHPENFEGAFTADGILFDSGDFSGMNNREALPKMMEFMEGKGFGRKTINYRLRDWLISRQRYWGAPIPIVYDPEGNPHPVPEELLPWELTDDVEFRPTGEAPLSQSKKLLERTEKIFGKGWRPEVDTLDTFMCSSWYYLRYCDNKNPNHAFDKKNTDKWMPVDMYIGGPEHACMHLLYARFVNMALHEFGHVSHKEPFKKLIHQGMITKDGAKMSKSKGNVVSPDEFVEKYGSDVLRMYLMFMGPFTEGGDWSDSGITGIARFVDRFWRLVLGDKEVKDEEKLKFEINKLIKKCSEDIEVLQFNTAIAALMEFVNFAMKNGIDEESKKVAVQCLAPLAPHLAEECWQKLGNNESVFESQWPQFDKKALEKETVKMAVQVNGKVRGEIEVSSDASKDTVIEAAKNLEKVNKHIAGKEVVKEIFVPGRIVGFVVKG